MKALTCEMCGSANIVKQGDFYVCQSCGTKFAAEKRPTATAPQSVQPPVMPTGSIRIDASGDIERLYEMARLTRRNNGEFMKLYKEILEKDPNGWGNWEVLYYAHWGNFKELSSRMPTILGLVKNHVEGAEQQEEILRDLLAGNIQCVASWKMMAEKEMNESLAIFSSNYDKCEQAQKKYGNALLNYTNFMYAFGDEMLRLFGKEKSELFVESWKTATGLHQLCIGYLFFDNNDEKKANKKVIKEYEKKIEQYTIGGGEPIPESKWKIDFDNLKDSSKRVLKVLGWIILSFFVLGLLAEMCSSDDKSDKAKTEKTTKADSVTKKVAAPQEQKAEETVEAVAVTEEEVSSDDEYVGQEEPDGMVFTGTVGDYPITMVLYIVENDVSGYYYYDKQGSDKCLQIKGAIDVEEGTMSLYEFDENGESTGRFLGNYSNGVISGAFKTKDGKLYKFKVNG